MRVEQRLTDLSNAALRPYARRIYPSQQDVNMLLAAPWRCKRLSVLGRAKPPSQIRGSHTLQADNVTVQHQLHNRRPGCVSRGVYHKQQRLARL